MPKGYCPRGSSPEKADGLDSGAFRRKQPCDGAFENELRLFSWGMDMHGTKADALIRDAVRQLGRKPRILVTGKTGAGKSSLINALLRKPVAAVASGKPCTQAAQEEPWILGEESLIIVDVPGFAEADRHEERTQFILDQLPGADAGLLVVGAPDRAWEYERRFIEDLRRVDPHFPLFLVGNRIDMFNPVRDWNPQTLNLQTPSTVKERTIVEWGAALRESCGVDEGHCLLVCAGERFDDPNQYGLDILARRVVEALPEVLRNEAARAMCVDIDKRTFSEKIIWGAAVAASGVAVTPIPFADAALIGSVQAGMILNIAHVYGKTITRETAASLLAPVMASLAGRTLFVSILKIVPGLGTLAGGLVGAAIAGPITLAIGYAYLELFARNNFHPEEHEVKALIRKKYKETKRQADALVREARERSVRENPKQTD